MAQDHSHHGHGLPWKSITRIGRPDDQCEVHHDARVVHPHGAGKLIHHDHAHARSTDKRRLALTIGVTATILVLELVGGIMADSFALISDAGHMLTDLSAQVLSLLALLFATRPATARRTYGYYRLEILAALVNGVALVVLAGFIFYKAWQRLGDPPPVHTGIMMSVAAVGLAANLVGAWLLAGAHSLNVKGARLHIISDALSSVAVLIGGAAMALWKVWALDSILSFAIAGVIVVSAYRLVRETAEVLLEAVPADIDLERLREEVRGIEGIEDVHDLHVWTITSGLHALSAHIVVKSGSHTTENDELLTRIKGLLLRNHRIAHSTLQIESTEYEHVSHVH